MCKYCEENISIGVNDTLGVCIHYPNRLVVRGCDNKGWDLSIEKEIDYCPMCGRALEKMIDINEAFKVVEYWIGNWKNDDALKKDALAMEIVLDLARNKGK